MSKNTKVLLVEDNELSRDMLARRLKSAKYDVIVAEDGAQARSMIEQLPDVVLLDMMLPDEDGWTLAAEWKAMEQYRALPIIAVSAMALREHVERGLRCGCDAYVTKPVDFKTLREHIDALTSSASDVPLND